MQLADFYSLMAITCFTLVGLWWTVVERHPEWKADPTRRRLAGGVYLSYLLPGRPDEHVRTSGRGQSAGLAQQLRGRGPDRRGHRLVSVELGTGYRGLFRRFRWLVAAVYGVILLVAIVPGVATAIGGTPLQVASVALILLVVMAHGLTWEFMMEPESAVARTTSLPTDS